MYIYHQSVPTVLPARSTVYSSVYSLAFRDKLDRESVTHTHTHTYPFYPSSRNLVPILTRRIAYIYIHTYHIRREFVKSVNSTSSIARGEAKEDKEIGEGNTVGKLNFSRVPFSFFKTLHSFERRVDEKRGAIAFLRRLIARSR